MGTRPNDAGKTKIIVTQTLKLIKRLYDFLNRENYSQENLDKPQKTLPKQNKSVIF